MTRNFEELIGKTMVSVTIDRNGDDTMTFTTTEGKKYKFYHSQDCCESVTINDVAGELDDLVGSPLLVAEETTNSGEDGKYGDTCTWTFYRFATQKGWVNVKWYGSSNGYYSESVDFTEIT